MPFKRRTARGWRSKTTRSAVRSELSKLIAGHKTQAPGDAVGRAWRWARRSRHNLGTKVIYVEHGSFDTRMSVRKRRTISFIEQFSDAIAAFYDDRRHATQRQARAHDDLSASSAAAPPRTASNSRPDHGEALTAFLIGGGVKGGVYGEIPSSAKKRLETSNTRSTSAT